MKKGFTLIEIIGVIIILSAISLIAFPIISKSIKDSKESALEKTIDSIEKAAYNYSIKNTLVMTGELNKITLDTLKEAGYLENQDIIDPMTNEVMMGCVMYRWDKNYNHFEFNYEESCS